MFLRTLTHDHKTYVSSDLSCMQRRVASRFQYTSYWTAGRCRKPAIHRRVPSRHVTRMSLSLATLCSLTSFILYWRGLASRPSMLLLLKVKSSSGITERPRCRVSQFGQKWKTICILQTLAYRSIFNHCDVICLQRYRIREIKQNKGYYAVQGHSRLPMLVPIERPYATSY